MVFARCKAMKTLGCASSLVHRTAVLNEGNIANHAAGHGGLWEDRARQEWTRHTKR